MEYYIFLFLVLGSGPAACAYDTYREGQPVIKTLFRGFFYLIPVSMMGGIHVALLGGFTMLALLALSFLLGIELSSHAKFILQCVCAVAYWPINFKLIRGAK